MTSVVGGLLSGIGNIASYIPRKLLNRKKDQNSTILSSGSGNMTASSKKNRILKASDFRGKNNKKILDLEEQIKTKKKKIFSISKSERVVNPNAKDRNINDDRMELESIKKNINVGANVGAYVGFRGGIEEEKMVERLERKHVTSATQVRKDLNQRIGSDVRERLDGAKERLETYVNSSKLESIARLNQLGRKKEENLTAEEFNERENLISYFGLDDIKGYKDAFKLNTSVVNTRKSYIHGTTKLTLKISDKSSFISDSFLFLISQLSKNYDSLINNGTRNVSYRFGDKGATLANQIPQDMAVGSVIEDSITDGDYGSLFQFIDIEYVDAYIANVDELTVSSNVILCNDWHTAACFSKNLTKDKKEIISFAYTFIYNNKNYMFYTNPETNFWGISLITNVLIEWVGIYAYVSLKEQPKIFEVVSKERSGEGKQWGESLIENNDGTDGKVNKEGMLHLGFKPSDFVQRNWIIETALIYYKYKFNVHNGWLFDWIFGQEHTLPWGMEKNIFTHENYVMLKFLIPMYPKFKIFKDLDLNLLFDYEKEISVACALIKLLASASKVFVKTNKTGLLNADRLKKLKNIEEKVKAYWLVGLDLESVAGVLEPVLQLFGVSFLAQIKLLSNKFVNGVFVKLNIVTDMYTGMYSGIVIQTNINSLCEILGFFNRDYIKIVNPDVSGSIDEIINSIIDNTKSGKAVRAEQKFNHLDLLINNAISETETEMINLSKKIFKDKAILEDGKNNQTIVSRYQPIIDENSKLLAIKLQNLFDLKNDSIAMTRFQGTAHNGNWAAVWENIKDALKSNSHLDVSSPFKIVGLSLPLIEGINMIETMEGDLIKKLTKKEDLNNKNLIVKNSNEKVYEPNTDLFANFVDFENFKHELLGAENMKKEDVDEDMG